MEWPDGSLPVLHVDAGRADLRQPARTRLTELSEENSLWHGGPAPSLA